MRATARAQSRTVYLNRNGVTLSPGPNDSRANTSSIISTQVHVPAWRASSDLWSQTVACLRDLFAPFDVHLTETDPGNLPHIEAVFGGSTSTLGLSWSASGLSPFSTTCTVIENSIVFAFTDVIPQDARFVCELMAQEIGHSYGLDHELLASDPLSYLPHAGNRAFQDVLADCGEYSPRPCGVTGWPSCRDKQNSYALLWERIGAAGTGDIDAPVIAITSPENGAIVDPGFSINATITDDVAVKRATVSIDGVVIGSLSAEPWVFAAPEGLSHGKHLVKIEATDGANEMAVSIEVTIRGAEADDESPIGGCSIASGTGGASGLFLVLALLVTQPRKRRYVRAD